MNPEVTFGKLLRSFSILLFLQAGIANAQQHLVDTSASDFNCSSVRPGETVIIRGNIRGPLNIRNCLGTSEAPILIRNDTSADSPVVIRRASGSSYGFVFSITNSRHIIVDGTGGWKGMPDGAYCGAPSGRNGCGIIITSVATGDSPTAYYTIHGQNMRDQVHKGIMIDGAASYHSSGASRIGFFFNDHSQPVDGPLRENVTFTKNYVVGVWGEGMYLGPNPSENTTPLGNIEVSHSLFEETGRDGVEVKSVYKGVASIVSNVAINVGKRSDPGQQSGFSVGGNSLFESNYVERAGEIGIRAIAWTETPGSGPFETEIFNNVVVGSGVSGPHPGHGISVSASNGFSVRSRIYNNTVLRNLGRGINIYASAGAGEIWNNISVENQDSDIGVGSGSVAENNLTGDLALVGFVDPINGDYRLLPGSPAIDAAVGTSPTTDFNGIARPFGNAPDLGAFEHVDGLSSPRPPSVSVD